MRYDIEGMFWNEVPPPPPPKKEKPKRIIPERTWESPDYLPHLEEALAFDVPYFTDEQLIQAYTNKETLIVDIECYKNFFQVAFKSLESGLVIDFILREDDQFICDNGQGAKLYWIVNNFLTVSFYGLGYDLPVLALALHGLSTKQLKEASDLLIQTDMRAYQLLAKYGVEALAVNHIDIKEPAPLNGSLKVYSGRLHCRRMQDLPFHPDTYLSTQQSAIVRLYCVNDLDNTITLYKALKEPVALRAALSVEFEADVRSKSDPQIAEAVIQTELQRLSRKKVQRAYVQPGAVHYYKVPPFLSYQTELLNWVLETVRTAQFVVSDKGVIITPATIRELSVNIANTTYTMGIGGLHSCEESVSHYTNENESLHDFDVESYYPKIVLNQLLYPKHLGPDFLKVYRKIVQRRIAAKHAGDKSTSDSLKIVINGTFGKLGSPYSILYSPDLLIQVTLTGQLSLLMLIERMELSGISVVSANTDGIVVKCPSELKPMMYAITEQWQKETAFVLEETQYRSTHNRDVNNYVAIKTDGKVKTKGVFAKAGLSKNPTNEICVDAITEFLTTGAPIDQTVCNCKDITKFISIRAVKGGAVKDGIYLGKVIRWYYAISEAVERPADGVNDEIVYATTGNKVPRSEGAKPLMDLPDSFPTDINYDWYIEEAKSMLSDIGVNAAGSVQD